MPPREPNAFESELEEHLGLLSGYARQMTNNEADALDLVQDTLVRAIGAGSRYQARGLLGPWLSAILKNTLLDRHRRERLERHALRGPDAAVLLCRTVGSASLRPSRDAPSAASTALLREEVERALASLPLRLRDTVRLADIEQMSYRGIADELGCPMGTVMSRLHRGRERLRARLSDRVSRRSFLAAGE